MKFIDQVQDIGDAISKVIHIILGRLEYNHLYAVNHKNFRNRRRDSEIKRLKKKYGA